MGQAQNIHADHPLRFESFLLAPGEKKVEMKIDTSEWPSVHQIEDATNDMDRDGQHEYLHVQQGRSHYGQSLAVKASQ